MSKFQSIFKRFEKKYLINSQQYKQLGEDLTEFMLEDSYGEHTICNLYYDTEDFELIRRSIEKPVYKEKLRVRSYGVPRYDDTVFLELKKKYLKEVFKRRVALPYNSYIDYINDGLQPKVSTQILSEIQWFLNMYKPYPRMFIAYDRTAMFGKEDENVRVTFDNNTRYRIDELCLTKGDHGSTILNYGERIMEIKVEGAMPIWLTRILGENKILPKSFSKYGACYKECTAMGKFR